MKTRIAIEPAAEPVTLDELKSHLNLFADLHDRDAEALALGVAAREHLEKATARALVSRTLETSWDGPPRYGEPGRLRLPVAPVESVESVTLVDASGVATPLDGSSWIADVGTPGGVAFPAPFDWPCGARVVVRYVAGYGGPAAVPERAKLVVRMLAAHWFGSKTPIVVGAVAPLPFALDALLGSLKWGAYPQ